MSGSAWPALVAGAKAKASEVEAKFDWMEGDIVPMSGGTKTDATYDLGESSFRWRDARISRNIYAGGQVGIGTTSPGTNILLDANKSTSGSPNIIRIANANNGNTASHAQFYALVGGTAGGDPYTIYDVDGATKFSVGIDNSNSDRFKISASVSLGTSDLFIIDPTTGWFALGPNASLGPAFSFQDNSTSDLRFLIYKNNSTGDPYINLSTDANNFSIGMDNSDSDKLKIAPANGIGTGDVLVMTQAGQMTLPLQPAFLAYNSSSDQNVTGNNVVATVELDTEVFDQSSDFNNSTDTFTAPITGKYLLSATVNLFGLNNGSHTFANLYIVTSNRTYQVQNERNPEDVLSLVCTVVADMDAADTASVQVMVSGGAQDVDLQGVNVNPFTFFSGHLVA